MSKANIRELAFRNADYRSVTGQFVFTETDLHKFIHQIRDKVTDDVLSWYNAAKKAETPDDPYWKGYQHAIEDVIESAFDQLQFEDL